MVVDQSMIAIASLLYLVILVIMLVIGGFVFGWSFRKGWDAAGPRGIDNALIKPRRAH